MIAGGAKTALSSYEMSISLPNVVVGRGHCIDFPSRVRPICVLFDTPAGPIALEVGLDTSEVELATSLAGEEALALAAR
jgi:CheY-specific phosphatase CheX